MLCEFLKLLMQKITLETFQKRKYFQFMIENLSKIVGFNLKSLRKNKKLSQKDISGILSVSYQQVQKYESGFSMLPIEKLYRLKHYYGVTYDTFFEGMGEK